MEIFDEMQNLLKDHKEQYKIKSKTLEIYPENLSKTINKNYFR